MSGYHKLLFGSLEKMQNNLMNSSIFNILEEHITSISILAQTVLCDEVLDFINFNCDNTLHERQNKQNPSSGSKNMPNKKTSVKAGLNRNIS
jgi:hypothetical protein